MSKFNVGDPVTWKIGEDEYEAVVTEIQPTNYHEGFDYAVIVIETEPDVGRQAVIQLGKFLIGDAYDGSEAANEEELMPR